MRNNITGIQKTIFSHYTRQCICLPLGFVFLHNKKHRFCNMPSDNARRNNTIEI